MRYVAAYLLSSLGGKENPSTADIDKILSSVGIESDSERVNKIIGELKGKNIEEVIAAGKEKLATVPTGGGAAPAAAAAAPAAGSPAKAAESKKEEKKEESDQSDDDMGFGLFD